MAFGRDPTPFGWEDTGPDMGGATFGSAAAGARSGAKIIACYRIKHDHWSSESALQEAEHYGISKFELGMRQYIGDFGQRSTKP